MHIFDRLTCVARDCRSVAARNGPYCREHVPVFYRDQNDRMERPCQVLTRDEVKELKDLDAGKFENRGLSFRLFESRPAPIVWNADLRSGIIPVIGGRNSSRKIGEGSFAFYKVQHFSYPVPAWGARNRPQNVKDINQVPAEVLAASALLSQVQA